MRVRVTAEHVEQGRCGSLMFCPVALAVKDALGLGSQAQVTAVAVVMRPHPSDKEKPPLSGVHWPLSDGRYKVMLPEDVGEWIRDFDQRKRSPTELVWTAPHFDL